MALGFKANNAQLESVYQSYQDLNLVGNQLWAWGFNSSSELGLGNTTHRSSPVQVGSMTNWSYVIVGSSRASFGIDNSGKLWAWGNNSEGQLGLGDRTTRSLPTQVGTDTNWSRISSGGFTFAAVRTDGTIWVWGSNNSGYLGLGDTVHRSSPTQVGSLTNWKEVATDTNRAFLAIKTDGTLWGWGQNNYGKLGLNDNTDRTSPVQVGSLTNWSKVYFYGESVSAIKTDGTIWSWGYDGGVGQLGLGDSVNNRSSPTQIGSLTNWSQISKGGYQNLAIKTDGTLWAWGRNLYGQLGLNNTTSYSSPVQVGSLTNWSKVFSSSDAAIASKTDGTLWTWGYNSYGTLGLGDLTHRSSPVQVGSLTNWSSVSGGYYSAMAITNYPYQSIP